MDALLGEKRRVVALTWGDGQGYIKVGLGETVSIEVEAVNGQMADTAWFIVRYKNGSFSRHNAALLESVDYAPDEGEQKP